MKYHQGTRKRRDVKVHYIRREYNSNIVPDAKANKQANTKKGHAHEQHQDDHP